MELLLVNDVDAPKFLQVVGALAYLQVKHLVGDFFLQTTYQVENKGTYGHPGGLIHAGIHAGLTIPVFFFLPATTALAVAIIVAEYLIHYHTDWTKEAIGRTFKWNPGNVWFWRMFGIDQFVHQMTYVAILVLLVAQGLR